MNSCHLAHKMVSTNCSYIKMRPETLDNRQFSSYPADAHYCECYDRRSVVVHITLETELLPKYFCYNMTINV